MHAAMAAAATIVVTIECSGPGARLSPCRLAGVGSIPADRISGLIPPMSNTAMCPGMLSGVRWRRLRTVVLVPRLRHSVGHHGTIAPNGHLANGRLPARPRHLGGGDDADVAITGAQLPLWDQRRFWNSLRVAETDAPLPASRAASVQPLHRTHDSINCCRCAALLLRQIANGFPMSGNVV